MLETIETFINNSLIENEITEKTNISFRGSALPVCQRKLLLGKFYQGTKLEKTLPFSERYNYHVGRAIHALAQETWASQGLLWGDYRCEDHKNCGVKFTNTLLTNGKCIRCGSTCLYIEKQLIDRDTGFSGHCDAPVYVPALDSYVIFELKSRNSNIISKAQEPYQSDLYQVSMYATLLARTYWLRIIGRVILWIGKPRPKPFKFWFYPGIGEDLAEEQFRLKKDMEQKLSEGRILEIEGLCRDLDDTKGCPFAGVCLSPVYNKLIMAEYKEYLNCQT